MRRLLHQAVELGGARLVEARLLPEAEDADRLQNSQRPEAVGIGRVFRLLKGHRHVALRGEVVDLVGLHLLDDAHQAGGIRQIAVVQDEAAVRNSAAHSQRCFRSSSTVKPMSFAICRSSIGEMSRPA